MGRKRRYSRLLLATALLCAFVAEYALAAPTLPLTYIDSTYAPLGSPPIEVLAGADFQAAINAATCGDTLQLQAGATFVGNFELPPKNCNGWIYIQSSRIGELPGPGQRVNPSHAAAGLFAKIVSPNTMPAIATVGNARRYRLIGLEITTTLSNPDFTQYNLVWIGNEFAQTLSDVPGYVTIDRCYIHGDATTNVRRGIGANGAHVAVVDSYISDIHEVGADSQAIGGWFGPGPFKFVNNFLAGAGENIMFGGSDCLQEAFIPSDIEIRKNHLFKPLAWQNTSPRDWVIKNLFELKNAQRVLVQGNILENNWPDAQNGFGILFTPRNQSIGNRDTYAGVQNVTFRDNVILNSYQGLNVSGTDDSAPSKLTDNILVSNNLWWNIQGRTFQFLTGNAFTAERNVLTNVTVTHNTVTGLFRTLITSGDDETSYVTDFKFLDNLSPSGEYGIIGSGRGTGLDTLNTYFRRWDVRRNVIAKTASLNENQYPADNFFAANVDALGLETAADGIPCLSLTSPYRGTASDGTDPGIDCALIRQAIAGVREGVIGPDTPGPSPKPGPLSDTTAPVVRNLRVSNIKRNSAVIRWSTDEAARAAISYWYKQPKSNSRSQTLATNHSRTLRNLKPGTKYSFQIRVTDAAGNAVTTRTKTFRTKKR